MNLEYVRYINKYAGTYQFEFQHVSNFFYTGICLINRVDGGAEFSPAPNVPARISSKWIVYVKRSTFKYHNYHGLAAINLENKNLSAYQLNGVRFSFEQWKHFVSKYTENETYNLKKKLTFI